MNGKRETIKELTNAAWSILFKYEQEEKSGIISKEAAQQLAIDEIRHLRYGDENKDYFWITDLVPRMVMHPYRADLDNSDLRNFTDPHGKKLFVELVNTAKKDESGFVDYMWQWKDDPTHIVPKLSYVKIFKPWNWVIGTGIYIDDVKRDIKLLNRILIWISISISFLISLLLFFIAQQSLKSEQKRLNAEVELHESKEKYKTLVEATVEGLMLVMDGRINYVNHVFCKMTGFEKSELFDIPITKIISNQNSQNEKLFSEKAIKEGQFEIIINKKGQGNLDVLATSSKALFFGKMVNIIVLKDISLNAAPDFSEYDYQRLLSLNNIGFFRTSIDSSGKFIYASEITLRILGYQSLDELCKTRVVNLFASTSERKELVAHLLQNGFVKNKYVKINKRNGEPVLVSLSMVVFGSANEDGLICDGIMQDVGPYLKEKAETTNIIANLKASNFILEQSVKPYLKLVISIHHQATIGEAIKMMEIKKSSSLLVFDNELSLLGIVTQNDIRQRVIAFRLNLDNPIYLIMSSPVLYCSENTLVGEALSICNTKNIGHLLVRDGTNQVAGVFDASFLYKKLKDSLSVLLTRIEFSEDIMSLKEYYNGLQNFIKPLIENDYPAKQITRITSSFSDAITRKVIELSIAEFGKPPVEFSFICLGSEGRKEESLFTDQDNAIIYQDVAGKEENEIHAYFCKIAERICDDLNFIGYSFCKGNIMAKNPLWCKSLGSWMEYFTKWIKTPEPQNLLDASIFFDFRAVYGSVDFADKLREHINPLLNERSLFLYHMAKNVVASKSPQIVNISDKNSEVVDLKLTVGIMVVFARVYSLNYGIWHTNTIDRLETLKDKAFIQRALVDEIIFAYNFLMGLRFKNQLDMINAGLAPSNLLDLKKISVFELSVVKKILTWIPVLQSKLNVDFRINEKL